MNKKVTILTTIVLLSLPISHYAINYIEFSPATITTYWLSLGLASSYLFHLSRKQTTSYIMKLLQATNGLLGAFGMLTGSLMAISFL